MNFGKDVIPLADGTFLNCTAIPEECSFSSMKEIVSPDAPDDIYISPVGCYGIVRRKMERNLKINPRLEEVLLSISSEMTLEEIEKRSRIQHRGRFSAPNEADCSIADEQRKETASKSVAKEKGTAAAAKSGCFAAAPDNLPEGQ